MRVTAVEVEAASRARGTCFKNAVLAATVIKTRLILVPLPIALAELGAGSNATGPTNGSVVTMTPRAWTVGVGGSSERVLERPFPHLAARSSRASVSLDRDLGCGSPAGAAVRAQRDLRDRALGGPSRRLSSTSIACPRDLCSGRHRNWRACRGCSRRPWDGSLRSRPVRTWNGPGWGRGLRGTGKPQRSRSPSSSV